MQEPVRKIIHLDMDCFYAAIEMRDHPEYAGQPLAVGGARDRRGVLTTCNYEARKYGVHSAMPTWQAIQRCPQLVVMPVRFEIYRRDSARIRQILYAFSDLVEPLSLDEAYLDVSGLRYEGAVIAAEIRARILEETGLTSSAGIAPNKLLAKIASDWKKPNGQFEIRPDEVADFMEILPVRRLWGVGRVSAEKLACHGVTTCGDLRRFSLPELARMFGKFGAELFEMCRGIDQREVEPDRERKSLSCERTFTENIETLEDCESRLDEIHRELLGDLGGKASDKPIWKIFVKLRFADFSRTTAERIAAEPRRDWYLELLEEAFRRGGQSVRLIGLGVRFALSETQENKQLEMHW